MTGSDHADRFSLAAGATIGRYQIVRLLARGGMGEVYLCRVEVAGGHKPFALKRIRPEHVADPQIRAMFLREARLALDLDHPGVATVLDVLDEDGEHGIVMEYVHGRSVRDLLRALPASAAASTGAALAITIAAARALHYVHERCDDEGCSLGLVHRDVSPENVMARYDGGIKIIDFGIARVSAQTVVTQVGVLKGKIGYMSPEQLRQDPIDRRSDVFGLGLLGFELTTGHRAYTGDTFAAVMNQVLSGEVPRADAHGVPKALADIWARAMAYEPEDRHASADELAAALQAYATAEGIDATTAVVAEQLAQVFGPAPSSSTARLEVPTRVRSIPTPRRRARGVLWVAALAWVGALALVAWGQQAASTAARANTERQVLDAHERASALRLGAAGSGAFALALGAWVLVRRRRDARGVAVATTVGIVALGGGCAPPPFSCDDARGCDLQPGGWCDGATHRCAYPDDGCEGPGRFGPLAGAAATTCAPKIPEGIAYAQRIMTTPVIDGDPTELQLGPPIVLTSDTGLGARAWLRWNDAGLYVGAVVDDPQVIATAQAEDALWRDDGIEVLFDTAYDRADGPMPGPDDVKFVLTPINARGASWGGIDPRTAWDTPMTTAVVVDGTLNQRVDADAGYAAEMFVPWPAPVQPPRVGTTWGMNLKINDRFDETFRALPWHGGEAFNVPARAGVLVFADGEPPSAASPRTPSTTTAHPLRKLDLADAVEATSDDFDPKQPASRLFDGCEETRPDCAAGVDKGGRMWVRFDLGAVYELGWARLFGDTRHDWVSRAWTLRVRRDADEPWTIAFADAPADDDAWRHQALDAIAARWVEVEVLGGARGIEARELELYGRAASE
jgi:tRNA A-37 threonylcarbamoyl transferase component Bud32